MGKVCRSCISCNTSIRSARGRPVSGAFVPCTPSRSARCLFGQHCRKPAGTCRGHGGAATAHAVHRTEELIAAADAPHFKLNLQLSGHGILLAKRPRDAFAPRRAWHLRHAKALHAPVRGGFPDPRADVPAKTIGFAGCRGGGSDRGPHRLRASAGQGHHAVSRPAGRSASRIAGTRGPSAGGECG